MLANFLSVLVNNPASAVDQIRLQVLMKMQSRSRERARQVVIVAIDIRKDGASAAPHSAINNSRLAAVRLG